MRSRRWLFFGLVAATTGLGTLAMLHLVGTGGLRTLEVALLLLFTATFGWISVAFWTGIVGFVLGVLRRDPVRLGPLPHPSGSSTASGASSTAPSPPAGRTALVMPVYNEDPDRVVSGLRAMVDSLRETGSGDRFDAFLLSDTDNPSVASDEVRLWELWGRSSGGVPPEEGAEVRFPERFSVDGFGSLTYRRRPENTGQKAGNVAEFCRRWGRDYDYMVILDADSLMSGSTLVTLARFMDDNPGAGLVQTVPIPARQVTLLGRLLQFAQALHAPLYAAGQSFWQAETANYWGHNAILRVRPFMEHCRLPELPGSPPLGGRILSHDFVEAALLRRGGWTTYLHPWLGGSWEGVPGTLPAYATRDRRWAQGSLQHIRLLREPGLHPLSRIHFTFGALGYVSSVLWLLLLLGSTAYVILPDPGAALRVDAEVPFPLSSLVSLLLVTAILLLLPRFLALSLALRERAGSFGGPLRLAIGFLLETLHSVVVAPVLMLYHTRFVASILAGRTVSWNSQERAGHGVSWKAAWRSTGWMTLLGLAWAGLTLYHSATFFLWLTPIFVGLVFAVPIVRVTSRRRWGRWTRKRGLFLVPTETDPHNVLRESERPVSEDIPMPPSHPTARKGPYGRGGGDLRRPRRRSRPATGEAEVPEPLRVDDPGSPGSPSASEPVERALFELQRGRPVVVEGSVEDAGPNDVAAREVRLVAAVESLGADTLSHLERRRAGGSLRLVVTHHRASAMGLFDPASDRTEGGGWSLRLSSNGSTPDAARILHLSSALDPDLGDSLDLRPASPVERRALDLVRRGRMLPALVSLAVKDDDRDALDAAVAEGTLLRITSEEIRSLTEATRARVVPVSDSRVPLDSAENARFLLFRERPGLQEHLAVVIGEREDWPEPLPVRLHSACLTGDLFGSLRCDCGEQLRRSLDFFAGRGGGVLLYLSQEGRSIGLANKLRAYALQQDGLDTVDANRALGFEDDERRYEVAVAMLAHLDIRRVDLLTNNPEKVRALEAGGIEVAKRVPLHGTLNRHNLPYVSAKVHRAGHWLDEMLGSRLPERPGDGRARQGRRKAGSPGGAREAERGSEADAPEGPGP